MTASPNTPPLISGPASGTLMDLNETVAAIRRGAFLCIAADEALLRQLPQGNWLAGSIPYFMGPDGGETSRQKLFVTQLPAFAGAPRLRWYDEQSLPLIAMDAPSHGLTVVIVPAFSEVHSLYARQAPAFEEMYLRPLVGWIAGVHLDDLGHATPVVVNGQTLGFRHDQALAIHIPLPETVYPRIDIVNPFQPRPDETLRFPRTGFSVQECRVNGQQVNLADYLVRHQVDTRLPLMADYSGALVNVSFKAVNATSGQVDFYAPVFDDIDYHFAQPVADYGRAFAQALPVDAHAVSWSCNCILNYLHGDLQGKRTGPITGPMTFGEIAYQLLNQTLVHVHLDSV